MLMRSCHADEAEALELVRVCFEDVDLDKDGRVCFEEYRAFCKKAKRVLRRRALTAHSTTNARTRGAEVRRLTFGSGFASARANSRETKTKPIPSRPASARLASRSLDALGNAKEKAPRPASAHTAQFFSRSFSEAPSRERVEPGRSSLHVAEESGASFAEDSTLDLTPMDLTSMDLTVDDAFIAEKDEPPRGGSSTRDLEPVAEALETDEERRGGGDDAGDEENALFQILTEDAMNERLAVWRAEFDAHDARGTGRLDLELATFALAKLRLRAPDGQTPRRGVRARALPAIAPPIARLTKCGAASENGRRANRESRPRSSHRASGRASDRRRRKPGFPGENALSSAPRREPSRCDASSSEESSKGPESSSWDLRPKGAYRDAEPKFRVAGASSGSCGRG